MNERTEESGIGLLSPRERQILALASAGLTDKEIASRVGVSLTTVRTHWERLRDKTRTVNRAQAVAMFVRGEAADVPDVPETAVEPDTILKAAIDTIIGGILVVDRDFTIIAANEKIHALANVPLSTLIGKSLDYLFDSRFSRLMRLRESITEMTPEDAIRLTGFMSVLAGPDLLVSVGIQVLDTPAGRHNVLVVRDQMADIDARRRRIASGGASLT